MLRRALAVATGLLAALGSGSANAAPGELSAIEIDTIGNDFGYWEYLPEAYDESESWPLFIFLSGIGENGVGTLDPTACADGPDTAGDYLCRALRHGPQSLLWRQLHEGEAGLWNDEERPFVVIAPQNPAPLYQSMPYDVEDLDGFVQFVIDTYAIDTRRMYLVGMSMGGYSTVLSLVSYPHGFAAVSMMPGIAGAGEHAAVCDMTEQNMWIFHGENDGGAFPPVGMVSLGNLFSQCPEPKPTPRITVYQGLGHDVWTPTISPEIGMSAPVLETFNAQGVIVDLDPYDVDLYTWLLQHDKPVVDAGSDVEATMADAHVQLHATTEDDDAVEYTWTQTSGSAMTLANTDTATIDVSGFQVGAYTFEVLVVDADGQHDVDEVTLTIVEAAAGESSTGEPPTTSGDDESTDAGTTEPDAEESESAEPASESSTSDAVTTTAASTAGAESEAEPPATDGDDSGCSCATTRRFDGTWLLFFLLLGVRRRE